MKYVVLIFGYALVYAMAFDLPFLRYVGLMLGVMAVYVAGTLWDTEWD